MDLSLVVAQFCETPVYYFDQGQWVLSETKCRMPPYDRFISDRAFGQKKRILQTLGGELLPAQRYLRVGRPTGRVYIVESLNEDLDEHGEYLNVYMVREATTEIEVHVEQDVEQASGAKRTEWVYSHTIWGDFDRYGVLRSSELPVDYTSFTVSLMPAEELPKDCRLKMEGQFFAVTENFIQLELRQLRVRGING